MLSPAQSHPKLNFSLWLQVGSNSFGQRQLLPEAAGCPALLCALLSISTSNHLLEAATLVFMPLLRKHGIPFKTLDNISDEHNYLQIISDLSVIHTLLTFGNATAF